MKRKRWFAMILVLCLLIPLMPLSFASATELAPGQIIPDGIYYIRNTLSEDYLKALRKYDYQDNQFPSVGLSVNGYHVFHEDYRLPNSNAQNIDASLNAAFLWRITYIGDGRYSIFSVFDTSLVLAIDPISQVNDTPIICAYQYPDAGYYQVPQELTWRITYDENGFVLQNEYFRESALAIEHHSQSDKPYVVMDHYYAQAGECHWELIAAPEQIFFHTTRGLFYENPVCYVAPEETLTLEELGLRAMLCRDVNATQQIRWESSDYDIAIVDDFDGTVIGVSYGQCTITATYTKNGETVSNSYTLKVAPLAEGTYRVSNTASELFVDNRGDTRLALMSLSSDNTQMWFFDHIEKNIYCIVQENEMGKFYLAYTEDATSSNMEVVLMPAQEEAEIPCWEVNVTSNGNYILNYDSNESLYMQQSNRTDDSRILLSDYTENEDKNDEWQVERVCLLRVYVYFDDYVSAYDTKSGNALENIRRQLMLMQDMYWIEFRINIKIVGIQRVETLINECSTFVNEGECLHGPCKDSKDKKDLSTRHHTNFLNILLNLTFPEEPVDAIIAYIGHETCGYKDREHWDQRVYDGYTFAGYGIVGINNISVLNGRTGLYEYNQDHCTMTLIHEIGHLFYAKDHYGQMEDDKQITTDEINRIDYEFAGMYSEQCIYSEERDRYADYSPLPFCDGCRGNILKNKYIYYI